MQNVGQESSAESQKLNKVSAHEIGKSSTPQSSNSSPTKSDTDPFSEINPRYFSESSESEEDDISLVISEESFSIDPVADLDGSDARIQTSKFLLTQEDSDSSVVDPETHARLEALLEAAGIGKLATDGKQLADPEVLRRLTSSVSCALDEAAAALTRMRSENPRPQPERSLVEACTDGDVGTVKKLLTEGRSVHETTDEGESLLSLACSAGYYELVQVLLAMHANVEDRGIKGDCTPLMEAASTGYVDIVLLLIHHGADVNAQSSSGNTPLMYACAGGHLEVVRVLIEAGANVEDHNENGHTPLMEAASAGHVAVAEILLERGAGINTHSNEFKESALTLACYKGHLDMVRFLLDAGADREHKTDEMHTALMEASMDGHVEVARLLLDSGAQVNMPTDSFESPLTLAACGGHVDLALLLLERGANIEEVNDEGYTPLMEAAREGHEDMVAVLLVKGANINAQTEETQETALTLACCGGFLEVANFLIRNGAEIELGASTPLMEAAQEGHIELVKYLLEAGAEVNAQTQTGDTALTYACENGHTDVARLLLQYGADMEHESEGGRTPLMKACRAGHLCTVKFLLEENANANKQTTNNDHTPLSLAAAGGHIAVVELLLSHSANPFHKLKDNSTMLIEAAKGGHTNVVQLLLDFPHSIMMRGGEHSGAPQPPQHLSLHEASENIIAPEDEKLPSVSGRVNEQAQGNGKVVVGPINTVPTPNTSSLQAAAVAQKSLLRKSRLATVAINSLTSPEAQQVRNQPPPPQSEDLQEHSGDKGTKPPPTLNLETHFFQRQQIVEELQRVEQELKERTARGGLLEGPLSPTNSTLNNLLSPTTPPGPPPDPSSQGLSLAGLGNAAVAGELIQLFCEGMVCQSTGVFHTDGPQQPIPPSNPPFQLITTPSDVLPVNQTLTEDQCLTEFVQATAISDRPKAKPAWKKEGKILRKQAYQAALSHQQQYFEQSTIQHLKNLVHKSEEGASGAVSRPDGALSTNGKPIFPASHVMAHVSQLDMNSSLHVHSFPHLALDAMTSSSTFVNSPQLDGRLGKPELDQEGLDHFTQDEVRVLQSVDEMANSDRDRIRFSFMAGIEAASKFITPGSTPFPVIPNDQAALQGGNYQLQCQELQAQLNEKMHQVHLQQEQVTCRARDTAHPTPILPPASPPTGAAQFPSQLLLKAPPPWMKEPLLPPMPAVPEIEPGSLRGGQVQTGTQTVPPIPTTSTDPPVVTAPTSAPKKSAAQTTSQSVLLPAKGRKARYQVQKGTQAPPVHADSNHSYPCSESQPGNVSTAYGMDVDSATDSNNDTALTLACAGGHEELVELLLNRGANIEHRDKKGFTPLILAATAGHEKVVEILMNHSADMEAQSERTKDTPLSLACSGGRFEVVELLLSKGANKEHRNVSDYTPLSLAASGGYVNIIKLLLNHGAEINSRTGSKLGISPLMLAAMNGHTAAVKLLLDMGSDINAQIETNRNTALTLACFQGRHEVVSLLLDRRANVEHRAKTGLTPLMEAASGGYVEVGRVLLDKGADVNAPPVPSSRDTALTIAADKGHCRFVELLLSRNAQVEVKNKKGNSPLWLAANGGHLTVVEYLYNAGSDIDSQDNRKVSCLMAAFRKGHVKVVKWMVNAVTQFPSDQEMTRYIGTVNDKELLEKCQECTKIIRTAKDQQAAKANKNATILLEELYMEKTREENKRAAAARRRERKKKKKIEKKEEKRKLQEENQKNERYVEEEEEEEDDGDDCDEDKPEEIKTRNVAASGSPARVAGASGEGEEGDSGIDANSQGSCSSNEVKTGRRKEKKKKKPQSVIGGILPSTSKTDDKRETVVPSCSKNQKDAKTPEKSRLNGKPGKQQQQPLVFEPTRHPADREDFEATGNETYISVKGKKPLTYLNYCEEVLPSNKCGSSTSPKQVGKKDEGWKEVVRKYLNSPFRSKKVSVPLHAISRVIGRGGSNINAIRTATGAYIEVEKQSKGQGERIITLKGSTEATKQAHLLIAALIKDPEVDILQILPKSANKSAAAVWEKSVNTAKSKPGNKALQGQTSTASPLIKTTTSGITTSTLVATTRPATTVVSTRVTAPRLVAAAAKRQLGVPLSNTKTTMSYTSVIMTSSKGNGTGGKPAVATSGQTFAAKLSSSGEVIPSVTASSSVSVSTSLCTTLPVAVIAPTYVVTSAASVSNPLPTSPSHRQDTPPMTVTPPTLKGRTTTSPSPQSSHLPLDVSPPPPPPPPSSTPSSISSSSSTSAPTAATLEYSLFNDNFTKVTQQSMWGGRDGDVQKGMNFASAAAAGAPNSSTVIMPPQSNKYLDPSPPKVDASKAPGYRGNAVCSPVSKGTAAVAPTCSSTTTSTAGYFQPTAPSVVAGSHSSDNLPQYRGPPPQVYPPAPPSSDLDHQSYHQATISMSRLNPRAPDFSTSFKPPAMYQGGGGGPYLLSNNNVISLPMGKYPPGRINGQTRWPVMPHGYHQTEVAHLASLGLGQPDLLGPLENGATSPQSQPQDDRKVPPRPIGMERAWKNYSSISTAGGPPPELDMTGSWMLEPKMSWAATGAGTGGLDRHHMYRGPNTGHPPQYSRIAIPQEDIPHIMDTSYQNALDNSQYNGGGNLSMMHTMPVMPSHYTAAVAAGQDLVQTSDWEQNNRHQTIPDLHQEKIDSRFNEFHRNALSGTLSSRPFTIIHDASFVHSAPDTEHTQSTEDMLFDMFTMDDAELISVGKFLAALRQTGLRKNDPRLSGLMENLRQVHKESGREGGSPETQKLDREAFKRAISSDLVLISRAFRHHFIIPDFCDFTKYIEEFYWKCKSNTEGKVADYIPQLARSNPDHWGVSVCTIDGQRFSIGDVNVPFTLQSTSKPLTYGIALDQLTQEVVHKYVGQEPSGRNFNELVLDHNKKPHNPMINAGAILVCSLLKTLVRPEMTLAEKFDFIMDYFKRLAGGEYLGFNNAVFLSEREAADRNYALGFFMREHKCYPEKTNLKECMDFYFQCCSMEANCESMSVMAATLANGGICPLTEEKVLKPDAIRDVLSLMHSCGMYDYSGQFAFKVGLPAKSGVSGGMLIVIPNVMGICSWSPPLDPLGNSCRGVQFCEELVSVFNFHRYDNLKHATNKKDPRRHKYETKGLTIVNLLFSAASGDVAALRRHKLSGMDMSLSDYDGRTALHLAAAEGHLDCVKFLLEQCNVPYDNVDRWGNSPLTEAKTFGRVQVVQFINDWASTHPSPAPKEETQPQPKSVAESSPLP